jgi:hypothetical protein
LGIEQPARGTAAGFFFAGDKTMAKGAEQFVSRGKRGPQVRKVRTDGWTKAKREIFFAHFAATANASASALAAGMTEGSAFKLRERDPEFAARWDAILRDVEARLTGKLIVYVETKGKPVPPREDGEPATPGIEDFDPELALRVLAHNRRRLSGGARGGGPKPKKAGKAETAASILRLLDAARRRLRRRKAR